MYTLRGREVIRVLVADDDEHVLGCYREAFCDDEPTSRMRALEKMAADLFDPDEAIADQPKFDVVACRQGEEAIRKAETAAEQGKPFDVVILDVRMPPGIDGVEAGSRIRRLDPDVEIVFVTGYSDIPLEELRRRVPPPERLHYLNKPLSFSQLATDVATMVRSD